MTYDCQEYDCYDRNFRANTIDPGQTVQQYFPFCHTFVENELIVKSLRTNLLSLFFSMATAAEMASGIMVRCISKSVSCSRKGLYCGEMGSQP